MEEPFPQMNPIEEPVQDCLESLLPNIDFDNNCSSKGSMSLNDSVMIGNIGNDPHFRATQEMEIDSMLMDFFDNFKESDVEENAEDADVTGVVSVDTEEVMKSALAQYKHWQTLDRPGVGIDHVPRSIQNNAPARKSLESGDSELSAGILNPSFLLPPDPGHEADNLEDQDELDCKGKDATMVGFWEKSQKSDQMPYFGQNLVGF